MEYDFRTSLAGCWNNRGIVYLAQHRVTKHFLCVKKYHFDKARDEAKQIKDEICTMRQFSHANILPLMDSFVVNLDVYMVTPLMCYGSCKDTLHNCFKAGFPEPIAVFILRDLLHALDYLHKKNYIHRSVRASHILLEQNKAVLTGFRDCISMLVDGERVRSLHNLPESNNGKNLNWLAPELLEQNLLGYNEKSDVYSVGVTLCELCNNIEPFADMKTTLMLTEKIRGNQPSLLDYSTCPDEAHLIIDHTLDPEEIRMAKQAREVYSSKHFSDHLHKFTEVCMQKEFEQRPSVGHLLNHSVFKQLRNISLQDQFVAHEIHAADFSKINDPSIHLMDAMEDLNMTTTEDIDWDF